jgi:nucleoside-diphosphate-sugar epimerase
MLAGAFSNLENFNAVLFCSGVSNSREENDAAFEREKMLLLQVINENKNKIIVYFSSVEASTTSTPYYKHKSNIEDVIRNYAANYLILRLPQIVGISTNNTIFPSFVRSLYFRKKIRIFKNTRRHLIDVEDVVRIVRKLITKNVINTTINVSSEHPVSPLTLVNGISECLGIKPVLDIHDTGCYRPVDLDFMKSHINNDDILLKNDYALKVIQKYSLPVLQAIINESDSDSDSKQIYNE